MQAIRSFKDIISKLTYIIDRKYKRRLIYVFIVLFISSVLELIGVTAIVPFIQAIIMPDSVMNNRIIAIACDAIGIQASTSVLMVIGFLIIVLYLFKNAFMIFSSYVQEDFSSKFQMELSNKMLVSYLKRPYVYFLDTNSSIIIRGCGNDISGVYNILSVSFQIASEMVTVLLIASYLVKTDVFIALSILIVMSVIMIAMLLVFKPMMKKIGVRGRELGAYIGKLLYQMISGVKEIYAMQRQEVFEKEYFTNREESRKLQKISGVIGACPDRITEGVCISGIILIVCIRLTTYKGDNTEFVAMLGAFAMAAFKIFPSVGKITNRINVIVANRPCLDGVYENLKSAENYEKQLIEYKSENALISDEEFVSEFENEIVIDSITWKYNRQEKPVLSGCSMSIKKGESIGFIGESGAGKTTLSDLILGLIRPQEGTITVDGVDIFTIPKSWASMVGYVPQSVFLIDDTIYNNVLFGQSSDDNSEEKVWEVLEKAQLKSFVETLPDGINTIVGERGVKFSGGQKQRIAIARALYSDPRILVLDEATAALDNETETAVMESIDALQGKITMIIVAHRLTTIKNCDRIYEIVDGKAVERDKSEVLQGIS